jgi:hypothetical protein
MGNKLSHDGELFSSDVAEVIQKAFLGFSETYINERWAGTEEPYPTDVSLSFLLEDGSMRDFDITITPTRFEA